MALVPARHDWVPAGRGLLLLAAAAVAHNSTSIVLLAFGGWWAGLAAGVF
jgi:hypothetical protein